MKRLSPRILWAGAVCALLAASPAFAQAAANPGDLHTRTLHAQQYKGLRGYTAQAPEGANSACGVIHDFNTSQTHYQYIAVCPMFH
jgi:hypothetical protein